MSLDSISFTIIGSAKNGGDTPGVLRIHLFELRSQPTWNKQIPVSKGDNPEAQNRLGQALLRDGRSAVGIWSIC